MQVTPVYNGTPNLGVSVYFATAANGSTANGTAAFFVAAPSGTTFSLQYNGSANGRDGHLTLTFIKMKMNQCGPEPADGVPRRRTAGRAGSMRRKNRASCTPTQNRRGAEKLCSPAVLKAP